MFDVLPANINERKVLDQKHHRILKKGIKTLMADAGYRDKKRTTNFAKNQALLITPDISAKQAAAMCGPMDTMAITIFNENKAARKTAIEPTFDLLNKLLGIQGKQKPLLLRGLPYVSIFLGLGVMILQLAMLMNLKWKTRNTTHIKTVFQ